MKRHRPRPGPAYWDWRCLECGMDVKHTGYHLRWWKTIRWGDVALAIYVVAIMIYAVWFR